MEADMATQEAAAEEKGNPSSVLSLKSTRDYAIDSNIPTVLYVPDFISQTEQSQLLHHNYQASAPKWKTLKNRRLQNWGGVVHEKGLLPLACPALYAILFFDAIWLSILSNSKLVLSTVPGEELHESAVHTDDVQTDNTAIV